MPETLSSTQLEVLAKMRAGGGRIERWPGGFWTIPGTAFDDASGYRVPEWYAVTTTVRALAARGLIVPSAERDASFVVEYRLVD